MPRCHPVALAALLGAAAGSLVPTLTPAPARAQAPSFSTRDELADLPTRWADVMDLFDVPGVSVFIVKDGAPYAAWAAGVRNPSGEPVDADTVFYLASMTKTFTATGVCMLADEGRISLDDPVKSHLPRLDLPDAEFERTLLIRDLLCHRFGITSRPIQALELLTGEITDDRYYHWLPQAEIGGSIQYSNLHFSMLGRVIESVTGQGWRDFLDRSLFEPSGMPRTTGYMSEFEQWDNIAVPMERDASQWRQAPFIKTDQVMHAAGGLCASASDIGRFMLLHLADGNLDGQRFLSPDVAREMRSLEAPFDEPRGTIRIQDGYGLGWEVGRFNDHPTAFHSGDFIGARTYFVIMPQDDLGFVVLLNARGHSRDLRTIIIVDLFERLTGERAPFGVYENYVAAARERRELGDRGPDDNADIPGPKMPSGVRPGVYANDHWGTLHIAESRGALAIHLGACKLALAPGPSTHEILIQGPTLRSAIARFEPEAARVLLMGENLGQIAFQRD